MKKSVDRENGPLRKERDREDAGILSALMGSRQGVPKWGVIQPVSTGRWEKLSLFSLFKQRQPE